MMGLPPVLLLTPPVSRTLCTASPCCSLACSLMMYLSLRQAGLEWGHQHDPYQTKVETAHTWAVQAFYGINTRVLTRPGAPCRRLRCYSLGQ